MIANSKIGNCSRCGAENVPCRKRAKDLLCVSKCCRSDDTKKQLTKQQAKLLAGRSAPKIRKLVNPDKASQEQGSVQSLVNDLDDVFSKVIRLKYANTSGEVSCFVCGEQYLWTAITNGHYVSRGNKRTRFMEENCYPQCSFCNYNHNENPEPFKKAIDNYKSGTTAYLEEIALDRSPYKFNQYELKTLLYTLRDRLKTLQSKLIKK